MKKIFKILFMVVAMIVVMKVVKKAKAEEEKAQQSAKAPPQPVETPDAVIVQAAQSAASDLAGWKNLNPNAYEPAMKLNNKNDWIRFRKKYRFLDKSGWEWSYRYKHQGLAWNKSTRLKQIKAEFDRREAWI